MASPEDKIAPVAVLEPLTAHLPSRTPAVKTTHELAANFFPIEVGDLKELYRYDLKITEVKRADDEEKGKSTQKKGKLLKPRWHAGVPHVPDQRDLQDKEPDKISPKTMRRVVYLLIKDIHTALLSVGPDGNVAGSEKTEQMETTDHTEQAPASTDNHSTVTSQKVTGKQKEGVDVAAKLADMSLSSNADIAIASAFQTKLITAQPLRYFKLQEPWEVVYYAEDQSRPVSDQAHFICEIGQEQILPVGRAFPKRIPPSTSTPSKPAASARKGTAKKSAGNKPKESSSSTLLSVSGSTTKNSDDSVKSEQITQADIDNMTGAMNIILSSAPNNVVLRGLGQGLTMAAVGANKFFPFSWDSKIWDESKNGKCPPWDLSNRAKPELGDPGLIGLPGFFRSVRTSIGNDLLLNVNTTTGAFYHGGITLLALIEKFGIGRAPDDIDQFIDKVRVKTAFRVSSPKFVAEAKLKGISAREKTYTVTGLARTDIQPQPRNVSFTFTDDNEVEHSITVADHFMNEHNIRLLDTDWIVRIGSLPIFTPASLLRVIPGQYYRQKTDMVELACLFGVQPPDFEHGPEKFGIIIKQEMRKVPVYQLPPPSLKYQGAANVPKLEQGRWDLRNTKFSKVREKKQAAWSIVELVRPNIPGGKNRGTDDKQLQDWAKLFKTGLSKYGIVDDSKYDWTPSLKVDLKNSYLDSDEGAQNSSYQAIKKKSDQAKATGTRVLMVLLPERSPQLYAMVKRIGDQESGIHTICHVLDNKLWGPKTDDQFFGNLYMKFNLKLSQSAVNQRLDPKSPILAPAAATLGKPATPAKSTMLMGIDVTHPGASALKGASSIAAVVASVDQEFAQYPASLRANPRPAVLPAGLPQQIVIYRDGLSEAQFKMCKTKELPQILAGTENIYQEYGFTKLKVMLICAVKRQHARFFNPDPTGKLSHQLLDGNGNPKPGCFVKDTITYGNNGDFYLVSHETLKGTTSPTHYVVLVDQTGANLEDVAQMTHNLCYTFGRATRSVGLVTPAYYADLAADRARCYMRKYYQPREPGEYKLTNEETKQALRLYEPPKQGQQGNDSKKVEVDMAKSMFYI